MFTNMSRIIGFLILLLCGVACLQTTKENVNKHEKAAAILPEVSTSDSSFKQWAIDTIRKLSAIHYDSSLKKIRFQLSEDSLILVISENYQFVYNQFGKLDRNCRNLISLLKEYEELPAVNSDCSFSIKTTFYPSVSKEWRYEYVNEWDNITIKELKKTYKYGYIRGRLHDKKVLSNNPKDSAYYEFLWEGNKLIKKKMGI